MRSSSRFCSVLGVKGSTDKNDRQKSKNKSLNQRHENLQQLYEQDEKKYGAGYCYRYAGTVVFEYKYQAEKAQHYDVSCRHIREESDRQGEWFRKLGQDLYRDRGARSQQIQALRTP